MWFKFLVIPILLTAFWRYEVLRNVTSMTLGLLSGYVVAVLLPLFLCPFRQ